MIRFYKLVLVIAICAFALVAQLSAQPATTAAGAANAAVEAAGPLVPQSAPTLFHIGPLPVTNSMIVTWIVAALIIIVVRLTTWKVKDVPTTGQNLMETVVEGWESLMGNVLEPKVVRWVFPFATTFFLFIVACNFTDLFPGVGSIGYGHADSSSSLPFAVSHVEKPLFRPPTSDANLTTAMAGVFFVMSIFWALRYNGPIGLLKHIFGVKVDTNKYTFVPLLLLFMFVGAIETFSILFIRPVALSLRLYGNIFAGETMLTMAMSQKSILLATLLAVPGYFFETVVCLLQAFVFAMLTVAFASTLCTHSDEEHGH